MAKQTIDIGTTANDGTGTLLRDAFDMVNDNFTELYNDETTGEVNSITATAPISRDQAVGPVTLSLDDLGITTGKIADDAVTADKLANSINSEIALNTAKVTNATHTGDVTGDGLLTIGTGKVVTSNILDDNVTIDKMANDSVGANELVDNSVGAAALNVSDNGTAGYILKSDGDGSFSWIANDQGDITSVVAGSGMTGGGTTGDVTLNVIGGTGITANADEISLTTGGVTATQLGANSATPAKVSLFDDNTVATDTHILVADGTDYINKAVSGDATLANTGALTIANDAIITAKILDGNITVGKMAANSVDSDQYVDGSIDTIHIADDQVTFDKLEDRYTQLSALGSGTSFALNFSTAATFTATASNPATLTFSNAVQGQVIDLIITGNHALTFAETGATFNKVGSTSYAGGSTNLIQIICTDDSSGAKIYHYSIATYAAAQPQ